MAKTFVSQEGLEKLKKELYELENVKRWEVAERIKTAKELGDLSENVEYADAKDEQAFLEGRIMELKEKIKNAVVSGQKSNGEMIVLGSMVKVEFKKKQLDFEIVSANEVEPGKGKISPESPLGRAFLNKKKGEIVTVETPSGKIQYKIIDIN